VIPKTGIVIPQIGFADSESKFTVFITDLLNSLASTHHKSVVKSKE
jgi:hypothetical protein